MSTGMNSELPPQLPFGSGEQCIFETCLLCLWHVEEILEQKYDLAHVCAIPLEKDSVVENNGPTAC